MGADNMNLTDFLLARIAEDEAVARAGISSQADPENGWGYGGYGSANALTPHVGVIHEEVQAMHIVRWHPARVLAECEAKRRIVDIHSDDFPDPNYNEAAYRAMQCLALPYADHSDYREEWKP